MVSTLRPRPAAPAANDLERRRWRLYLVAAVIAGFLVVLLARLTYLQVIENGHFRVMATDEHWRQTIIPPRRGDIVDVNGDPLAASVTYQSLYASTSEIKDPAQVAKALAPILGASPTDLQPLLSKQQTAPVLIKAWLTDDAAAKVTKLGFDGLFLQFEPKRVYPQGNLAAQVLGVVGVDNNGLSGLELQFNADLAGKDGKLVAERDTAGDALGIGPRQYTAPINGSTLTLTIDRYVQWVADRELRAAVQKDHAAGGSVVILDPRSGAILAMAGQPTFHTDDPNLYSEANIAMYNIPAVNSTYSPGATFQVITIAAALDTGKVSPQTSFTDTGSFDYFGGTVHNAVARPAGPETMTQTLTESTNVGATWAATRVGAADFYRYARAFGIGQPTDVDLPGEVSGVLHLPADADWFPFDLARNAFGQDLAVTPLQMAVATAAVANGGEMMQPYVVKQVAGPAGNRVYYPTDEGRILHQQTAKNLTTMLVAAVDGNRTGLAGDARVPGYAVAGKSSLPASVNTKATDLDTSSASFVGYAPATDPRFVIVVQLDAPNHQSWSAPVAAPVFGAITRELLDYYEIPPSRPTN